MNQAQIELRPHDLTSVESCSNKKLRALWRSTTSVTGRPRTSRCRASTFFVFSCENGFRGRGWTISGLGRVLAEVTRNGDARNIASGLPRTSGEVRATIARLVERCNLVGRSDRAEGSGGSWALGPPTLVRVVQLERLIVGSGDARYQGNVLLCGRRRSRRGVTRTEIAFGRRAPRFAPGGQPSVRVPTLRGQASRRSPRPSRSVSPVRGFRPNWASAWGQPAASSSASHALPCPSPSVSVWSAPHGPARDPSFDAPVDAAQPPRARGSSRKVLGSFRRRARSGGGAPPISWRSQPGSSARKGSSSCRR